MDGILACTISTRRSEPGSNGNEWALHTLQIPITGASLSDAV